MKVLVTGANGQLGMCLREIAGQAGNDGTSHARPDRASHSFIFTDVLDGPDTVHLDITDMDAVRAIVASEGIGAVVNCAAYTNVDAAEDNFPLAGKLNAAAVGNLADAMKEAGGALVHISTDYVFGGGRYASPINEDVPPAPTGVYGLTKLHGEQAIVRSGVRYAIIRTAWLYSAYGKNFVKTMLRLMSENPSIKVVNDQTGTPTYAPDLAMAVMAVLGKEIRADIYHFSNEGQCTWYEFALAIAKGAGLSGCSISPCTSAEFPSKVHRPEYSVLDKNKIKSALGIEIPKWEDSLLRCLEALK